MRGRRPLDIVGPLGVDEVIACPLPDTGVMAQVGKHGRAHGAMERKDEQGDRSLGIVGSDRPMGAVQDQVPAGRGAENRQDELNWFLLCAKGTIEYIEPTLPVGLPHGRAARSVAHAQWGRPRIVPLRLAALRGGVPDGEQAAEQVARRAETLLDAEPVRAVQRQQCPDMAVEEDVRELCNVDGSSSPFPLNDSAQRRSRMRPTCSRSPAASSGDPARAARPVRTVMSFGWRRPYRSS